MKLPHLRKSELKILFHEVYERAMLDVRFNFYFAEDDKMKKTCAKEIEFLDKLEAKLVNYVDTTEFTRDEVNYLHSGLNYQISLLERVNKNVSQYLDLLEKLSTCKESLELC